MQIAVPVVAVPDGALAALGAVLGDEAFRVLVLDRGVLANLDFDVVGAFLHHVAVVAQQAAGCDCGAQDQNA